MTATNLITVIPANTKSSEYDPLKDPVYLHVADLRDSVEAISQLSALLDDTENGKILTVLAAKLSKDFERVFMDTVQSLPH
ncbi:MAG: hypothetical protein ACRCYD_08380 [Plesiomonas sp.]